MDASEDASEDAVSCIQMNEVIEPLQDSIYQDRKKYFKASRSKDGSIDSVSSNKIKKVRFSDQIDYCNFFTDTIGNNINTVSEDCLNEVSNEMFEIEELSSEVMSLNISSISEEKETSEEVSPSSASIINVFDSIENFSSGENKDRKAVFQENEENCSFSSVQRVGNLSKLNQTKRLNDLLKKDLKNSKAKDFKTAVYKAWTAVKKETKENFTENLPVVSSRKLEDEHAQKSVRLAYILWKKSKDKELKYTKKVGEKKISSNGTRESVKSDKEDNEIAFLSWKKKKDELLKQEVYNKIQDKRKAAEITLMNEEEKKKEGESAFLAWKDHKAFVCREEKKKKIFYEEIKQQAIEEKEARSLEALFMYDLWIQSKSYAKQRKWSKQTMKPPWYPPGNK